MKRHAWRFYVLLIYAPSLLIGAVLSVFMLPLVIGWIASNDLLKWTSSRIDKEASK